MNPFTIALPKGRLGEQALSLFRDAGFGETNEGDARSLVLTSTAQNIRFLLVKPMDVPIYVSRGVADLGVAGKDVLAEQDVDVYEMLDLGFGQCRLVIAAPVHFHDVEQKALTIATKYPVMTKKYFESKARQVDIITLHGSIELAPLVGLSDVIVDLVETGNTLRANGLCELETIERISARLIVNPVAFRYKCNEVRTILTAVQSAITN